MRKTTIDIIVQQPIVERNENIHISFVRKNHTRIQCGRIKVIYTIIHHNQQLKKQSIMIENQSKEETFTLQHCGYYKIKILKIHCYDILQCFCLKRKTQTQQSLYVFPTLISKLEYQNKYHHSESEDYDSHQKGQDYSEIFDIRQYQDHDSLKHIHWKLSMKKNELYVKEGSQPLMHDFSLILITTDNNEENDHAYDLMYSLCLDLFHHHQSFQIYLLQSNHLKPQLITNQIQLREAFMKLLATPITNHITLPHDTDLFIITSKGIS